MPHLSSGYHQGGGSREGLLAAVAQQCSLQRAQFQASHNAAATPHLNLLQAAAVWRTINLKHIQLAPLEVLCLGVAQLVGACSAGG